MTWLEYHDELRTLSLELFEEGLASWSELAPMWEVLDEGFVRLDEETEPAVEAAVQAIAAGEERPPLGGLDRLFLYLRVKHAADLAHVLHIGEKLGLLEPRDQSRWATLRWLLLEAWDNAGYGAIHGTIETLQQAWPRNSDAGKN